MFTGLIEATAEVRGGEGGVLRIQRPSTFDDIEVGSSISVSGVCLSVIDLSEEEMAFQVSKETRSKSNLDQLNIGDIVNLERAMLPTDRFEGHIVQGHIEGVGIVCKLLTEKGVLCVRIPKSLHPYIVSKGSIAINGVSLTVAKFENGHCGIALINHTMEHTNLSLLKKGDPANIETDIIGRYACQSCKT